MTGNERHLCIAEPPPALDQFLHQQQHGGARHERRGLPQPVPRGPRVVVM